MAAEPANNLDSNWATVIGSFQGLGNSPSSTSLAISPNPVQPAQPVSFTATVTSGSGVPTGMVTFFNSGTPLGSAGLNGAGQAVLTLVLGSGTYNVTAAYNG